MKERIRFTLNGETVERELEGDRMLLWVLRTDFGLTGAKYGCGESYCGACTVLVDDDAVRSCEIPAKYVQDKTVITIEGLARNGNPHPLQKAFMDNDALQCGYCTPGMIMNAYALLKNTPRPSEAQIRDGMEDNLCRCGAHKRIVEAIRVAAGEMRGF